MKVKLIMRDKDMIAFLNKERKNKLWSDIEVGPLTYKELQDEILIERIKRPDGIYPEERTLPNVVETLMYKEGHIYDKRYFNWILTYDFPDGQIYVQSKHIYARQALNRITLTYEKQIHSST